MGAVPQLTLLEAMQFLVEPLDCNANPAAQVMLAAATAWGQGSSVPFGQPLLEAVCRASCKLQIRPAILLLAAVISSIILVVILRNACVNLVRWYAAARGSAFVAVAFRALRELHASGALLGSAAGAADAIVLPRPAPVHRWYTPPSVTAPVVCCGCFQPVVVAQGAEERAQCCELCGMVAHGTCVKAVPHNCRLLYMDSLTPPPPPHETPQEPQSEQPAAATAAAVTSTATASARAPPSLPPPLPHDWRPAGTTLDLILPPADTEMLLMGGDSSSTMAGPPGASTSSYTFPSSSSASATITTTTIYSNNIIINNNNNNAAVTTSTSSSSPCHGPSSLCIYCGEPCEVGLLAVEPVWRCGGCRRFAHVQCWSCLHPDVLSAATRAALEGQAMEAEEISGSPRGASLHWDSPGEGGGGGGNAVAAASSAMPITARPLGHPAANTVAPSDQAPAARPTSRLRGVSSAAVTAATAAAANRKSGGGGAAEHVRTHRHSARVLPTAAAAAAANPSSSGGGGGGGGVTSGSGGGAGSGKASLAPPPQPAAAAPAAAADGVWDRHRRCHSLPDIAGHGGGNRGGAAAGGAADNAHGPQHRRGGASSGSGEEAVTSTSPTSAEPASSPAAAAAGPLYSTGGRVPHGVTRGSADRGRLARLDRCDPQISLGPLGAIVVPPTSVISVNGRSTAPLFMADLSTAAAAAGTGGSVSTAGGGGGGGRGRKKQKQQQSHLGRTLRQQAQQWYRSHAAGWALSMAAAADAAAPERWRHFRIGVLPPGCKPLLTFINPRSGPQAGEYLRRQLLQLLHPMQVVDLAREVPGPALRCWWGIPGLRVLVIGGNDLARVLGWGGGLAALDARGGVAGVLAEVVTTAAPTPVDRWALNIATATTDTAKRRSSFLPRRRQPPPVASRSQTQLVVKEVKTFNNYLGVGIDSWCALEFHRMRERYPGWFKSQLGNKMWYTGVGARDLLARSCVDLPSRLQLVCDGLPVELPPSTQGILLLNIPSYMGGVDLWGNGVSQQQQWGEAAAVGAGEPNSPERVNATTSAAAAITATANMNGNGYNGAVQRRGGGGGGGSGGSPSGGTSNTSGGRSPADAVQPQPQQPTPPMPTLPTQHLQPHPEVPQSISDGVLEVVVVYGAVHLGQLQVGLARATRLCQCRTAVITTRQALPMQVVRGLAQVPHAVGRAEVDGEPWMQPPAQLSINIKGSAMMLRRRDLSNATSRLTAAVGEVLDGAVARGTITAVQRQALGAEIAQRLRAPHAV
ncbi:diacylglycerol kinase [Volvox carteri f. nagariensis]|uniref:diacylglycerol kinase (ATP) n=1 Tax=Volvox carteri f. nagariensis TaxID=3068 RepID=D8U6C9_VOLCA|nr:diacylglycerol kinase [Volvox carteri f. nagariensis]EFJ44622.1 diacylglycerol kinase [Volvox carteri f. nagariensis]|eukprot:XP_002954198.1 diacylglycerol kinase [Volvox carteri f. nagariensis]